MSDTPRTDKAIRYVDSTAMVGATFARQLERELAIEKSRGITTRNDYREEVRIRQETERALAEARKDTERLWWVLRHCTVIRHNEEFFVPAQIDAAMESSPPAEGFDP